MPFSLWPFGKENQKVESNAVSSFPNAADSNTVMQKIAKSEGHEKSAMTPSFIDRSRSEQLAAMKGDGRAGFMDTDSIDCIVKHYAKEMTVADRLMKDKKQKQDSGLIHFYDYEEDRRYKQWLEDQQRVRDRLQIHWIDMVIDKPFLCLTYLARVGTTVGLFYGLGRSVYLYRTMDKMYAKLYGVNFFSIAFYEVSFAVVKGALVSAAGMVGVVTGDAATSLTMTFASGDVSVPDRSWYNVWACGTSCGILSGAAFSALHASILTPWGMKAVIGGFTAVLSMMGFGLGYVTYRPYMEKRQQRIYDPFWRPWQERKINQAGGTFVRGRYM